MTDRFDVDPETRERITAQAMRRGRQLRMRRRIAGASVAMAAVAVLLVGGSVAVASRTHQGSRVVIGSPLARGSLASTPGTTQGTSGAGSAAAAQPAGTTTSWPTGPTSTRPPASPTTATGAGTIGGKGHTTTVPTRPPTSSTTSPSVPPTSTANLPACTATQLVSTLSTAQPAYGPGQPIGIVKTIRNTGGACADDAAVTTGCWVGEFSASNSQNDLVWQNYAGPTNEPDAVDCPAGIIGSPVAAGWSESVTVTWNQTMCTFDNGGPLGQPNPDCPDTQVAPGTYSIVNSGSSGAQTTVVIS
jgi:hypothetical protein